MSELPWIVGVGLGYGGPAIPTDEIELHSFLPPDAEAKARAFAAGLDTDLPVLVDALQPVNAG